MVTLHDDVNAHGHAAGGARAHEQLAVLGLLCRAEHDHAIAERELRVRDGAALALVDRLLLEAEGAAKELDRGGSVLVVQRGDDGRGGGLGDRHG
jgi:hypothetical protein